MIMPAFAVPHSAHQTTPYDIATMPPGVPFIIGNEAAERFSFYGMKAILAVFMTKHLYDLQGQPAFMDDEVAKEWVHNFNSAVYFFPILGAIVSDVFLGKYRTILSLSLVYCLGHAVLALMDVPQAVGLEPRMLLAIGLTLISVGGGGIKPCVSAHVGDQFGARNQHLLTKVYGWFYFSINFGAMFSTWITPILLAKSGPGWAFGVPGILMALATFVFWLGRNRFVHIPPGGREFFRETFSREGLFAMLNLVPLYLLVSMFWALFDQTASAWVLQADRMELTVATLPLPVDPALPPLLHRALDWVLSPVNVAPGDTVQRWELLSSQIQAVNPLLVMLLIPIFTYGIYPLLGKLFEVTPLRKIGIGLFVTVLSFLISAWIQLRIEAGERPHINWQVLAYVVITAAEIMVSITSLEFSYTQAPPAMKSFIMGLYLLSITVGNLFVAQVNAWIQRQQEATGVSPLDGANYYWFFTGCMLLTAVLYVVWAPFYRGRTHLQGEAAST